jgi:hypothetical protein
VTVDNGLARPDGTTGAMLLAGIDLVTVGDIFQNGVTVTAAARYEPSFWIYPVSTSGNIQAANPSNTNNGQWTINLAALPTGKWSRITRSHPAVTIVHEFIGSGGSDGLHFARPAGSTGTVSFYVDFTQAELGTFSTSSIPTTAATANRNADYLACNDNAPASFSVLAKFTVPPNIQSNARVWDWHDANYSNAITLSINTPGNALVLSVQNNNVWTSITLNLGAFVIGNTYKIAIACNNNDWAASVNGGVVVTNNAVAMPAGLTAFQVGGYLPSANNAWGAGIQQIRRWRGRRTNAQLQADAT